jgi:GNAT superfamily N-acetyltransferase
MTSPAIEIVTAGPDELEPVARLFNAYRVFYRQHSDLDAARNFIRTRQERRDSVIFLARVRDEEAGFVQLYPSLSSVSMRPIWILNDLFVAQSARGHGVGRQLMGKARDFASASGAVRLELTTEHDNRTAQRLYEACGYVRDTVFYKYILTVDTQA